MKSLKRFRLIRAELLKILAVPDAEFDQSTSIRITSCGT